MATRPIFPTVTTFHKNLSRAIGIGRLAGSVTVAVLLAHGVTRTVTGHASGPLLLMSAIGLRVVIGVSVRRGLVRVQQLAESDAIDYVTARANTRSSFSAYRGSRIVEAWSVGSLLPSIDSGAAGALALIPAIVILGGVPALLVVGGLIAGAIPAYIRTGTTAVEAAATYTARRERLESETIHLIRCLWEVRGVGGTNYAIRRLEALSERESDAESHAVRQTIGSSLVTEFVGGVGVGLVAMVVGFKVLDGGSPTRALCAVLLTIELSAALRTWSSSFHARSDLKELRAELDHPGEIRTATDPSPSLIDVRGLSTYAPAQPVSFSVAPGECLQLQGPSGIGKSTILRAVIGAIEPLSGSVMCATHRIGFIDANPVFIEGSLADNVLIALDSSMESFIAHCHAMAIAPTVPDLASLPVVRGGASFSHGERIKFAIARALCNRAELLILDDVASFLDHDSRRRIANVIRDSGVAVIEATNDDPICQPNFIVSLTEDPT